VIVIEPQTALDRLAEGDASGQGSGTDEQTLDLPVGGSTDFTGSGVTPSGSLGLQYTIGDWLMISAYAATKAGSVLTVTKGFGQALFDPISVGIPVYFSGFWRGLVGDAVFMGLAVRTGASLANTWSATVSGSSESYDGAIWFGALSFQVALPKKYIAGTPNAFSVGAELGAAGRMFSGDLGLPMSEGLRSTVLGTTQTMFFGGELTTWVQLNSIIIYIRATFYPTGTAAVSGFSGFQVSGGGQVQGSLFEVSSAQ
jgi:hypothetical protein